MNDAVIENIKACLGPDPDLLLKTKRRILEQKQKGKRILIIMATAAILIMSGIPVYALFRDDIVAIFYTPSGTEKVSVEELRDDTVLYPDLDAVEYSYGDTVLSVPWGEREDTFACYKNVEKSVIEGPQSFTVGDDGTIYVYDTYNHKLKTFRNGKYTDSLDLYNINGNGEWVGIVSMVYLDGSIYALEINSNAVYMITGDKIEKLNIFGTLGNVEEIKSTPCGNLIIRDNYWQEGSIRCRKFDKKGNIICENKMGMAVSDAIYAFEDVEGNTVRMIDNGFKSYVFVIENKKGKLLHSVNFNTYKELSDASNDSSMSLIGTDSKGRMYMNLLCGTKICHMYLIRLDIENKKVDILEIPVNGINDDPDMPICTSMQGKFCYLVTVDGCVYKAYMTAAGGTQIVRFTFD